MNALVKVSVAGFSALALSTVGLTGVADATSAPARVAQHDSSRHDSSRHDSSKHDSSGHHHSRHHSHQHSRHASHRAKVRLAVAPVRVAENVGTATVRVTLATKVTKKVKLVWSTQGSPRSAKAGEDYTAVKGRVVLKPGAASAELVVPILNDTVAEGTEVFFVKFNGASVKVKKQRVKVTILDDDAPAAPIPAPAPSA